MVQLPTDKLLLGRCVSVALKLHLGRRLIQLPQFFGGEQGWAAVRIHLPGRVGAGVQAGDGAGAQRGLRITAECVGYLLAWVSLVPGRRGGIWHTRVC